MGAEPYWYFVKYRRVIDDALQELREREFRAGRYNPVIPFLSHLFPIGPDSPAPGAQHDSIEEAMEEAAEDGTRSILDIFGVAEEPDFFVAAPLDGGTLHDLYGTTRPTREQVENNLPLLDELERGHAVYVVIYRDGQPDEIFFGGYSFD